MRVFFLLLFSSTLTSTKGTIKRQSQCNALPGMCPQSCLYTLGGCSYCNTLCSKVVGQMFNNQQSSSASQTGSSSLSQSLGAQSSSGNGMSVSFLNPGSMSSFNNPQNPGNIGSVQTAGAQMGGGNSNLPSGYNPSNLGPSNPYINTGSNSHPGNPAGAMNPSNMGNLFGAVLSPSNPGASFVGSISSVVSGGNGNTAVANTGSNLQGGASAGQKSPSGSASGGRNSTVTPTCLPLKCKSVSNIKLVNGCPVCLVSQSTTLHTPTTKLRTTTPTTTPLPAVRTCAPLRCVAPCDKGITIGLNGCPICLCK